MISERASVNPQALVLGLCAQSGGALSNVFREHRRGLLRGATRPSEEYVLDGSSLSLGRVAVGDSRGGWCSEGRRILGDKFVGCDWCRSVVD